MGTKPIWSRPGSGGRTHEFYRPEMMHEVAENHRFRHTWEDPGDNRQPPAMRIGLAKRGSASGM